MIEKDITVAALIITTGDRGELFLRALRSVLSQTVKVDEIIVVVDGHVSPKIEDIGDVKVVTVHTQQPYSGPAAARNLGIQQVKSDYIALLDDDDYWLKNKIEIYKKSLASNADSDVLVFSRTFIEFDGEILLRKIGGSRPFDGDLYKYFFSQTPLRKTEIFLSTSTVMFKRNGFAYNEDLTRIEDIDFLLRYSLEGRIVQIESPLSVTLVRASGRGGASFKHLDFSNWQEWLKSTFQNDQKVLMTNAACVYTLRGQFPYSELSQRIKLTVRSFPSADLGSKISFLLRTFPNFLSNFVRILQKGEN